MWNLDLNKVIEQLYYNPNAPLIFNSGVFLWLFLFFITIYQFIYKHHRLKVYFLTAFSVYFYYKSSGFYFLLLLLSTVVDFYLAKWIYEAKTPKHKKQLLIISLIANLGMLGYYKYTNFLLENIYTLFQQPFEPLDIFLPVGISFFTFQSLSYTIDVYRGSLKPLDEIIDYAFFVSFFPQLVAGPIVRASDFIPQISRTPFVSKEMFGRGIFLVATGLFKKAVISDYISTNFADRIFDNPTLYTGLENLFAIYAYALQIYCDFSGYSDMAIGIALLLGYEFCINFDSPYQSASITEFWRRWHISLSSWLRDYLYIALGGNRHGKIRTYINLMLTMLLGGLWHGAAFRFILWGALHGAALAMHKFFLDIRKAAMRNKNNIAETATPVAAPLPTNTNAIHIAANTAWHWAGVFLTFHFVCFCWIFFRASDMQIAKQVIDQILFHFNGQIFAEFTAGYHKVLWLMAAGYILHFAPKSYEKSAEEWVTQQPFLLKIFVLLLVVILVMQVKSSEIQPFIYFQF